MKNKRTYIAIDLKSFYASVECIERGLDPLTTHLVVADKSRTDKTICLAVSPSLKAYGVSGRARLYEVVQKVESINKERRRLAPNHQLVAESYRENELKENPDFALTYVVAPPRMAHYIEYSTKIYNVYLNYVSEEDIHVYSIDEVFIDVTAYLNIYKLSPHDLAMKIIKDVLVTTGVTATAGIGTNMYLAKVAMDIVAKHMPPDKDGVRIAELDEISYREKLWHHRPLTDFWRVGKGYTKRLEDNGLYTMGDIARCSIGKSEDFYNEDLLYKLFGINAELLIDHAWGYEPCTIKDIKTYKPMNNSLGSGQVLHEPYTYEKAEIIVMEMADALALDLVDKQLVTDQIVLTIGYDIENLNNPKLKTKYQGEITYDHYGRKTPKHAHGTINLDLKTSSSKLIVDAAITLYQRITNPDLLIRRVNIVARKVISEDLVKTKIKDAVQLDLFTNYEKLDHDQQILDETLDKEKNLQKAILNIKKRYGKNSILKGTNFKDGATTIDRNNQIGGHKA